MEDVLFLRGNTEIDSANGVPEWLRIFPVGEVLIDGAAPVIMDAEAAESIMSYIAASNADPVIDYEHQTLTGGEAPAAGWLKRGEFKFKSDGFWGRSEWTQKAKNYITNKEYRYISPTFLIDPKTRRIIRLYNVALTNQPRMLNITPIAAKQQNTEGKTNKMMMKEIRKRLKLGDDVPDADVEKKVIALLDEFDALKKEGGFVKKEKVAAKALLTAIGLAEDADEKDAVDAIVSLKSRLPVAAEAVLNALGLPKTAGESEIMGTLQATAKKAEQSAEIISLRAALSELQEREKQRQTEELLALARKKGAISPQLEEWAKKEAAENPESFKIYIAKAAGLVPVDNIIPLPPRKKADEQAKEDEIIAAKFGLHIPAEDFLKYAPKKEEAN